MIKVLFTGGGGSGTEALVRLLRNRYELHFADSQQELGVIHSDVDSNHQHKIPWANQADFTNKIVELIKELGIDFLIPGVDEELPYLFEVQELLPDLKILAPDVEYIHTMMDKLTMAEAMSSKNLPSPGAYRINDIGLLDFPAVIKPRLGRGSRGVQILPYKNDISAYLQLAKRDKEQFVMQENLIGVEYTVMMSANYLGSLCAIVPVRVDEKRGVTISAEVVDDPLIINVCSEIHSQFKTKGCYNIQLMKVDENTAIPFEINPRISTTFCLGVAAGIDPIANYTLEAVSNELQAYKKGLHLRRYWNNYIY
jgi:carbamoyl-phosphate synthase large subunit